MEHLLRSATVRLVVVALAIATFSACGRSDEGGSADSATDASSPASGSTPRGGVILPAGDEASRGTTRIISVSNADGETSPRAVPLGSGASLRTFVASLGADLGPRVRAAARETDVPAGQTLMGAVVWVGCDTPTGIEVVAAVDGYAVTAIVPKSGVQCIVAVTSVALFLVAAP